MASSLQTNFVLGSMSPSSIVSSDMTSLHRVPKMQICTNSTLRKVALLPRSTEANKRASSRSWLLNKRGSHSLQHNSIRSARLPQIQAQMVEFKARREVSLPFREGAFPAVEYLKELERVVKVTFPDSARITYLGNSTWRTKLKPITFFTMSATPVCDIKVYNKGDTLQIHSDQLLLDFSGLPEEYINQTIRFNLQGQLRADAKKGSQYRAGRQVDFSGGVALKLGANLPLPFALFPETLLTTVGDGLLDTILGAMESALVRGVIADYHSWCLVKQSVESSRTMRVSGST